MISCHQHDFIEIACMYRYRVQLTLRNGSTRSGVAVDTGVGTDKVEVVQIDSDSGVVAIRQDDLLSMRALDENPHFSLVEFD